MRLKRNKHSTCVKIMNLRAKLSTNGVNSIRLFTIMTMWTMWTMTGEHGYCCSLNCSWLLQLMLLLPDVPEAVVVVVVVTPSTTAMATAPAHPFCFIGAFSLMVMESEPRSWLGSSNKFVALAVAAAAAASCDVVTIATVVTSRISCCWNGSGVVY